MEIGSFIEMQFAKGLEYYSETKLDGLEIARLNTGRAAIWHALVIYGCDTVWLPWYQCDSVRDFLQRKSVKIKYYHIDEHFNPIDLMPDEEECVLLVNYFGVMAHKRMEELSSHYSNVIIDNSQAFFAEPLKNCLNVYSARKFVGVPDGAYVIGVNAAIGIERYPQGYSSDTALFLLQRIEYGCEGKAYISRTENENRIEQEDCCLMSKLTHTILDGTDYEKNKAIRQGNFQVACELFDHINLINNRLYFDDDCIPMVYPLVVEDEGILDRLLQAKHFQGRWWHYLTQECTENSYECYLSKFMIPITIDQRYGKSELSYLKEILSTF